MLWEQQAELAQSIFLNFQHFIDESIQRTSPSENYFSEHSNQDHYFSSEAPFPLFNGIVCHAHTSADINEKCLFIKNKFKNLNYPITWFWPHDMTIPQNVQDIFTQHGFHSMGEYTSVSAECDAIRNLPIKLNPNTTLTIVDNEKAFNDFLTITKIVYGIGDDASPMLKRLYSAYQHSKNIKLYLAHVDNKAVATLLSFEHKNTVGLYNGATLENYRKQGLLTALMIQAIKDASQAKYAVAQLMAAQMAKNVCESLGFKTTSHFTPLCYGFDLSTMQA